MKNIRSIVAVSLAALFVLSGLTVSMASASSNPNDNRQSPWSPQIGTCPSQSFLSPPPYPTTHHTSSSTTSTSSSTTSTTQPPQLVLSISWTTQNDEDSGFAGYWAMDHYTNELQVWQVSSGNYYYLIRSSGVFSSPQGATTPGSGASYEPAGYVETQGESVYGTLVGGVVGTFTATGFNPSQLATKGDLGTLNYGGTVQDVLKGTYGNGQTGDSAPNAYYWWLTTYFTSPTQGASSFGFAYQLSHIFFSKGSSNQFCNYGNPANTLVSSGDIYVPVAGAGVTPAGTNWP
jgi:hypothetical protein